MAEQAEPNQLRADAIRGVKWSAVKNWAGQGIAFLVLLVMTRLLSPAEFGLYSIGSAIVLLLLAFAEQGLNVALVQRRDVDDAHVHTVFWAATGSAALLAAGLAALRHRVAALFGDALLADVLPVLGLVLPLFAAAGVINALLVRRLDFRTGAIATTASVLVGGGIAIAMAFGGLGIWSFVGQSLAGAIVGLGIFLMMSGYRPRLVFSMTSLREVWRFGFLAMAGDLTAQLNQRVIVLLIGGFLGPQAVGLFSVGNRVVDMGQQTITATIGQVATPAFARMQAAPERMKVAYLNGIQMLAAIICPVFGLLAVFSGELVSLFLGPRWEEGAPVLFFLALAGIGESLSWLGGSALIANGRPGLRLVGPAVSLIGTVVAFALSCRFGITVVAGALAAKAFLLMPVYMVLVRRVLPVSAGDHGRAIGVVIWPAIAMVAVAGLVRLVLLDAAGPFAAMLAGSVAGLLAYWRVLAWVAPTLKRRVAGYFFDAQRTGEA